MIRFPRPILAACALALLAGTAAAQQPAPVVLDGLLDEWAETPWSMIAAPRHGVQGGPHPYGADSIAAYARVNGVAVRHDTEAVYLRLRLERAVSLQAMEGTLLLLLDADANPATGWAEHGMRGVDAAVEFSPLVRGARAGAGLRTRPPGDTAALPSGYLAGVSAAPSHAAREFELRVRRDGAVRFGARMAAQLVTLGRDGAVVDALTPFTADLAAPAARPTSRGWGRADPLARAPGTDFRVVSWNVGRQDLFTHADAFGALLRPLAPDLLLFDEVPGGRSAEEIEALLNRILPGRRAWRVAYGVSGGSQRGVIAVRGTAPTILPPFAREIPYPDSVHGILPPDAPQAARDWLQSRVDARVPATGAMVRIGRRRLLAVTMDLECCGGLDAPADRLRRIEAKEIRDATERALADFTATHGAPHAILIAGDLNLVGSLAPLQILSRAVPDAALGVAAPLRLDGASMMTWEWAGDRFTPSRLDYVFHHPGYTEVTGGFVFSSTDLSPRWLARHRLTAETSRVTDHLPVVTDLRWVDPRR